SKNRLALTGTDLDVTLTCETDAQIDQQGSILIPFKNLLDITKLLPKTADVTFDTAQNDSVKVTCERAAFKLLAPDRSSFPEIPQFTGVGLDIPTETFS